MKTYSRTETIARINALAGANVPFLFIVDYAQEQSHIEPLDRIDPATCLSNSRRQATRRRLQQPLPEAQPPDAPALSSGTSLPLPPPHTDIRSTS